MLDFGVATECRRLRAADSADATRPPSLTGTPQYMSPEQARCAASVDYRTDIWALGVTAFECLLGYPPFAGASVSRVLLAIQTEPLPIPSRCAAVPKSFDGWCQRACSRDPARRFPSARDAADELERLFASVDDPRSWPPRAEPPTLAAVMAKRAFQLIVLFFAVYAFAFVPLGERTAIEHVRAIAGTPAARQAASEVKGGVERLVERLRREAREQTDAADRALEGEHGSGDPTQSELRSPRAHARERLEPPRAAELDLEAPETAAPARNLWPGSPRE